VQRAFAYQIILHGSEATLTELQIFLVGLYYILIYWEVASVVSLTLLRHIDFHYKKWKKTVTRSVT
jgi:hypothetical protein